jgi:hypothetical protein
MQIDVQAQDESFSSDSESDRTSERQESMPHNGNFNSISVTNEFKYGSQS